MRKLATILGLMVCLSVSFADENQELQPTQEETIAHIQSITHISGIAVVDSDTRLPNGAIVNNQLIWEGDEFNIDTVTGEISIRARIDETNHLPSITLLHVDSSQIILRYEYWSDFQWVEILIYKQRTADGWQPSYMD